MAQSDPFDCPICGTPQQPGAETCPVCGAALGPPAEPTQPASTPHPTPPPSIQQPPVSDEDTQPRQPAQVAQPRGNYTGPPERREGYDYGEDFDDGGLPPLPWRPIVAGTIVAAIILIILAILAGAGVQTPAAPVSTTAPTDTLPPLPTASSTATTTATTTPTSPPSETPTETLTPTPEYCCVTVLEGDTLIPLIGRCGHTQWQPVAGTVVAINDNVPNEDTLPPAGAEVCVPWPTPVGGSPPTETPAEGGAGVPSTPEEAGVASNAEATEVAAASTPSEQPPTSTRSPTRVSISLQGIAGGEQAAMIEASPTATPTVFLQDYTVQGGDTLVSVAVRHNTDVAMLATLNPQIDWSSCDFSNPGGGPGCSPSLSIGQRLSAPAPTYTPTLSPTPSGSETPTPTPTPIAPRLLGPADGKQFAADATIMLRWVPVGVLHAQETYLVHVEDHTTGNVFEQFTRLNQATLPEQARPEDGQPHIFAWTAVVTREGTEAEVLSGAYFEVRTFTWESQ
jgi:LysM repeat protein